MRVALYGSRMSGIWIWIWGCGGGRRRCGQLTLYTRQRCTVRRSWPMQPGSFLPFHTCARDTRGAQARGCSHATTEEPAPRCPRRCKLCRLGTLACAARPSCTCCAARPTCMSQQAGSQAGLGRPHSSSTPTLPGSCRLPMAPGARCDSDTPCEAGWPLKPQRFITPCAHSRTRRAHSRASHAGLGPNSPGW
jgi:hypothetical protein